MRPNDSLRRDVDRDFFDGRNARRRRARSEFDFAANAFRSGSGERRNHGERELRFGGHDAHHFGRFHRHAVGRSQQNLVRIFLVDMVIARRRHSDRRGDFFVHLARTTADGNRISFGSECGPGKRSNGKSRKSKHFLHGNPDLLTERNGPRVNRSVNGAARTTAEDPHREAGGGAQPRLSSTLARRIIRS